MILKLFKPIKALNIMDYELTDDDTEFGGIDFIGETVADFLCEIEADENITLRQLNKSLKNCGICPIEV